MTTYNYWDRNDADPETGYVFERESPRRQLKPLDVACECTHLASEHDQGQDDSPCRRCDCEVFRHK